MNDNKLKYTANYMIQFSEALSLIDQNSGARSPIEIDTLHSSGHVLAEDLFAPVSIPPFNNSAMDGYAVNSADLANATADKPVALKLVGVTAAGDVSADVTNSKGTACKIMTGAPVQDQYDAIIPVENTKLEGDTVFCFSSPQIGAHIRRIGEDFQQGEQIIDKGSVINANAIAALSSLGIAQIKVYPKTTVSVFSTGKELVDDLNTPLKPGQIRNSNKPYIMDWLSTLPVNAFDAGTNYDEIEKFENDLKTELTKGTDLIVSSGAVSMGDFDFIPTTITKLGGEIIFHKAKIRPGKPILFAKFPNGSFYIGLPGNPISAAIGLRFFVSHLLLRLQGKPQEKPIKSICINGKQKKLGFRTIWKAHASANKNAQIEAEILDGQESFKIKPLIASNGWVVLNEELDRVETGEKVDFYPSQLLWN